MTPIPLALSQADARSPVLSTARLLNLYASRAPQGAKALAVLYGTPGTRIWRDMGSPVRGLGLHDGTLVAVTGDGIYRLDATGTAVETFATDQATGPADIASTGTAFAVVSGGRIWLGTTLGIRDAVSADGYPFQGNPVYPADRVATMDGYLIFNRSGTGQFFFIGPGVTAYATTFDALDFATAEGAPDDTVALMVDHRELWLFGASTVEVWYNAGGTDPFLRIQGAFIEHGCAGPFTPAREDNTVFWLTDDGIVMRAVGYAPQRISTDEIEHELGELRAHWAAARAFAYSDEGHVFYVLTVHETTFVFDAATGLWHRRGNLIHGRFLGTSYAYFDGKHLVGTDEGQILEMRSDLYADFNAPLVAELVTGAVAIGRERVRMTPFEAEVEAGHAARWLLSWSDDRGLTWANDREATAGAIGNHGARLRWHRLGSARERRFRLRTSDPKPRAILSTAWVGIG